jgi:hypothetical protein
MHLILLLAHLLAGIQRPSDTLFFYDERGRPIRGRLVPEGYGNHSFIIKTTLTDSEVYADALPDTGTVINPDATGRDRYNTAVVNGISDEDAKATGKAIRDGDWESPLIRKNTIEILGRETFCAIIARIPDNGHGGDRDANNNREYYGWVQGGYIYCFYGPVFRPEKNKLREVDFVPRPNAVDFHTHPSGYWTKDSIRTTGTYPVKTTKETTTGFTIQGPSGGDQSKAGDPSYEFGMAGKQYVYVFNRTGILAIFRAKNMTKKFRKTFINNIK